MPMDWLHRPTPWRSTSLTIVAALLYCSCCAAAPQALQPPSAAAAAAPAAESVKAAQQQPKVPPPLPPSSTKSQPHGPVANFIKPESVTEPPLSPPLSSLPPAPPPEVKKDETSQNSVLHKLLSSQAATPPDTEQSLPPTDFNDEDASGCSYKVFYAMPCKSETNEQDLHLVLTAGNKGCHYFKRLAKDCQMPEKSEDRGLVVVPESSKFSALLQANSKRSKTDLDQYLGELIMAGEQLPIDVISDARERSRFEEEMLVELSIFDTQQHWGMGKGLDKSKSLAVSEEDDPPLLQGPGDLAKPAKEVEGTVPKQEANSEPGKTEEPTKDQSKSFRNLGVSKEGPGDAGLVKEAQGTVTKQEAPSEAGNNSTKGGISIPKDLSYDNRTNEISAHGSKGSENDVLNKEFRFANDLGTSNSTESQPEADSPTSSGDKLKDEISRAVRLGYAAGFKAGTEKSMDVAEPKLPKEPLVDYSGEDKEFAELMKTLMIKKFDRPGWGDRPGWSDRPGWDPVSPAKKPDSNNWYIKNMPYGKQKILIFQ